MSNVLGHTIPGYTCYCFNEQLKDEDEGCRDWRKTGTKNRERRQRGKKKRR